MSLDNLPDEPAPQRMTSESGRDETPSQPACPLTVSQQNRNLVRFAVHQSLLYLAAPLVYVGHLDAILLNKLGYCDKVANLPTTAYFWTTAPFLVLFTWYFCRVRMLKPVLVMSYAVVSASGLLVALTLLRPHSIWLAVALVVRATLMGWFLGIASLFEWEILARGVEERRRGLALSLAFGLGPLMAVLSSFGTQMVLDGKIGPVEMDKLAFPWDFLTLFAAGVLIMAVPALSSARYYVPLPSVEVTREPLISGVLGGFGGFLRNRLLMFASIAFLLTMLGNNTILPSVVLYTREAMGVEPQQYAGYQFVLEFAFKAVAGLLLGWMLTRTHPRAGLTATTSFCLAGVVWALLVPGTWYLVSFGLLGAGELYYVYYQNYLISCSPTSMVRRNLAYSQLLALPVGLTPVAFGVISDSYGLSCGIEVAAVLLAATIIFIQFALPRWAGVRPCRDASH
jgi:hypothetical protein